jgi:hypothetical protein
MHLSQRPGADKVRFEFGDHSLNDLNGFQNFKSINDLKSKTFSVSPVSGRLRRSFRSRKPSAASVFRDAGSVWNAGNRSA